MKDKLDQFLAYLKHERHALPNSINSYKTDLRHTFATRLRKGGVSIEDVSDFLGHSSIIITQRYSHRDEEKQRKAVEVLCKKSDEKV